MCIRDSSKYRYRYRSDLYALAAAAAGKGCHPWERIRRLTPHTLLQVLNIVAEYDDDNDTVLGPGEALELMRDVWRVWMASG